MPHEHNHFSGLRYWRALRARNSPMEDIFLGQSASQNISIELRFGDPGRNPVASGELLGHFGRQTEKEVRRPVYDSRLMCTNRC